MERSYLGVQSAHHPISLFISDIHLSESRNDIVTAFLQFVTEVAPKADRLYILGDLFDFWAGDDIATPLTEKVAVYLSKLAKSGVEIFFLPGNRDFALGKRYAQQAHFQILPTEYRLIVEKDSEAKSLNYLNDISDDIDKNIDDSRESADCLDIDSPILLIHGDELCIDDLAYQRYKRWIRQPMILGLLRRLPRTYRLRLADKIRQKSRDLPNKAIIDVNEDFTERFFAQKSVSTIIHGHTHRAGIHRYRKGQIRVVLSDWDRTGDYLVLEKGRLCRHTFKITNQGMEAIR
ncbi:UDP-2,3-diacylglucosamine hydrolase [Ignatzschineria ureiclastica]|uniref:UDP-2,3-diacylglucosamine hydrolase n=1 Tax=Ignatzschineria ureiclastica TaxID=472582 RepID=A0A2U2ACT6_9GAMM|nr:UDP-2,3-diacylglucosamine diphosphatase [Ignatzschineria ureiclastica]PWD80474.1 UDP-2,3-diacylglucosamine hydrolase [Ignatzschineria ureiclastica]GGZ99195.1 UDP-2,3-diacylglucosamine hydrolase [Ignatzschineria ureiclastica]